MSLFRAPPTDARFSPFSQMTRSPSRDAAAAREGQEHAAQVQYAKKQTFVAGGRGGVGNVRSPSRDPKDRVKMQAEEEKEASIQAQAIAKERQNPHTTGRGGAGNVKRESSTERGADDRGRSSGGVGAVSLKQREQMRGRWAQRWRTKVSLRLPAFHLSHSSPLLSFHSHHLSSEGDSLSLALPLARASCLERPAHGHDGRCRLAGRSRRDGLVALGLDQRHCQARGLGEQARQPSAGSWTQVVRPLDLLRMRAAHSERGHRHAVRAPSSAICGAQIRRSARRHRMA
jgi:hypothetical protein